MAQSHTSQSDKFYFKDLALPLRIATISVCGVLAFVSLAGTVRDTINTIEETPKASSPAVTQPEQPAAPAPTAPATPSVTAPQVGGSGSGSSTARCSASARASLTAQYNSQTSAENARHVAALNFLTASSATPAAFAAENAAYSANIAAINSRYQTNLRSIGC